MRLLASITVCAAVQALAPITSNARTQLQPRSALGSRRYLSSLQTPHGAISWQARRGGPRRRARGVLRSSPDDVDDEVVTGASDADFGGAVINAVTAVLGVAVAISTVCNLAGYGFMQTDEGLYFGTIQQTRMRYQLDQEAGRAR